MLPTVVTVTLVFTQSKNIMLMFDDYSLVFCIRIVECYLGPPHNSVNFPGCQLNELRYFINYKFKGQSVIYNN